MKAKINFVRLIVLILFKFILNNYAYDVTQNDLCKLNTTYAVWQPNICDRSIHSVFVSESENDCTANSKCWCILIDNRNRIYDGDMVIELVQTFNRDNLRPDKIHPDEDKSYLTIKIFAGLNRILVQPDTQPGALPKITSVKIRNNEICKFTNTAPVQIINFQQPTNNNNYQFTPNEYNSNHSHLIDCMRRPAYTMYSIKYCPNYRPEFIIEKRSALNNQVYWCIIINNDNNLLTSANHLFIEYSSSTRFFYAPLDAYRERQIPGSAFHLGNRKTFIAISENNNQLTDLNSVTIDNQPICNYFEPRVTRTSAPARIKPTFYSTVPSGPPKPSPALSAELLVATNQSIKIVNSDLIDYSANMTQVAQRNVPIPVSFMKSCGLKPIHKNPLISYGTITSPGDWPWHAAIYKLQSKINRVFTCGGTLINRKTIITAAHCVLEQNLIVIPDQLTVELGRHDLTLASSVTQEYRVYDVIPHEAFNSESYENNIAILILGNYIQVTRYVNYVCLPEPNEFLVDRVGTTVGWGLDENNEFQTELKEANLPVIDNISCLSSNRIFFGQYLTKTNFCAGFTNNTNVCRGDSGGGLVFKSKERWILGGIASLGVLSADDKCDLSQYVLFTDVTKFIPWIKQHFYI